MLNKSIYKKGMKKLSILFPNWKADLTDEEFVLTWYNMLKDLKDEEFIKMVNGYCYTEIYNPTIAGLRKDNIPENLHFKNTVEINEVLEWMDVNE